jgi:hypothetical protein
MQRRILLSTIHASDNYGSVLQATCLAAVLAEFGEVDVLDYRPWRVNAGYAQDWLPYQVLRRRSNREFVQFIGKHRKMREAQRKLQLTKRVWRPGPGNYAEYDTVVVGSDEVWSGLWGNVPAYFLADAPAGVRRVAYAVSAGRSSTLGRSPNVPEWLANIDVVHPRDASTARLCIESGITPDEVVCDPVMLVDPADLLAMAEPGVRPAGPYTLIYAEGCRFDERVGHIVRAIGAPESLVSIGFPYPTSHSVVNAGIPEFLGAVSGAELVVTSMFHGVVSGLSLGKTVAVMQHPAKVMKIADLIQRVGAVTLAEGDGFVVVAPAPGLEQFRASSRSALQASLS